MNFGLGLGTDLRHKGTSQGWRSGRRAPNPKRPPRCSLVGSRCEGPGIPPPGPPLLLDEYSMADNAPRSNAILKRQLETRDKLWPGVTDKQLWMRKQRQGFATMPRLMPQIMDMMDDLAGKGRPVGQTYLEMWCRLRDECFLVLNSHEEMAFCAGFSGQRAVRTWRERVRLLAELGFINVLPGPTGDLSYALFWNPYHVLKVHYQAGRIRKAKWTALEVRAGEVRATDLDDDLDALNDPEPAPATTATTAAETNEVDF
jgi:hypothetical protein